MRIPIDKKCPTHGHPSHSMHVGEGVAPFLPALNYDPVDMFNCAVNMVVSKHFPCDSFPLYFLRNPYPPKRQLTENVGDDHEILTAILITAMFVNKGGHRALKGFSPLLFRPPPKAHLALVHFFDQDMRDRVRHCFLP